MANAAANWLLFSVVILITVAIICFFLKFGGYGEMLSPPQTFVQTIIGVTSDQRETVIDTSTIDSCFPVAQARDAVQCAICLCRVDEGAPCRQLQCSHGFHPECISGWWVNKDINHLACPVCRQPQNIELREVASA
eukprot:gnl/TRDRNA2_/TRDRNA2_185612_c0_seq1.p1 gnl/TRDRNA2_/TRDRNA2_185612_c0~~gnl/TRDRNA2_/TRDRNA2_185612_c0_seq1.p1  ORF type:complete len:136 (-),score=13.77 gnl/TRDRNA2_/TRDRNA2_185612_c0_seq1:52-459(-)